MALRQSCWDAFISRRALAPVRQKQTGASALRLICHNDQHEWRTARFCGVGLYPNALSSGWSGSLSLA